MAVNPTYPGVYVQELPSGVRTITGVATSITLFVGTSGAGPIGRPIRVSDYPAFVRAFGEDGAAGDLARYLKLFFQNGGSDAWIVRIAHGAQSSAVTLQNEAGDDVLQLVAKDAGRLGDQIRAAVTYDTARPEVSFNLELFRWEVDSRGQRVRTAEERFTNLSMDPASPTYVQALVSQQSRLANAVDVTAAAALVPSPGEARAGRAVTFDGTDADFAAIWQGIVGTGMPPNRRRFRIAVGANPPVDVDLGVPALIDVTALPAGLVARQGALGAAIALRIGQAHTAAGIPGITVQVDFPNGPTPPEAPPLPPVRAGQSTRLVVSSSVATPADIRISEVSGDELVRFLMLGETTGGVEVGAHAALRPAPTGISLRASGGGSLNAFGSLEQTAITSVRLDELDAAGNPAAMPGPNVQVDLRDTPAAFGTRMFLDAAGQPQDLRIKLAAVRDAVNAYRAAHPRTFLWRAELWGSRLAFLPTGGDDNHVGPLVTAPTNLAIQFLRNARFATFGALGTAGLQTPGTAGDDGTPPQQSDYEAAFETVRAQVDLFNLLVLPPVASAAVPLESLWGVASELCRERRAFLIMDPPITWTDSQSASTGVDALRLGLVNDHSAIYFPQIRINDGGRERSLGAAGAMAGLYARIDGARGVWKAPAGTEATIRGVVGLGLRLSDGENGQINPVGVNALRIFAEGAVSWGARTMEGADVFASEYKYVPVRRTALFIEESLYRGLRWVVFEPNDEGLWAQIRLNVGAFMNNLFRQGAFQGAKPDDAYFVRCDSTTTTQNDRNLGIVNIVVGFAPLKPAEFVVLYLQQIAGSIQT